MNSSRYQRSNRYNRSRKSRVGSSLALVTIFLVLVTGGGWLLTHKADGQGLNSHVGVAARNNQHSQADQPSNQSDPYAGWQTYHSQLGSFSLRYPSTWEISGFRGDTPVGPGYSTGSVDGQETVVRLISSSDKNNQFGMDLTVNGENSGEGNYAEGNVNELSNGLSLWIQNKSDPVQTGSSGNCPVLRLVTGQTFMAKLANNTALDLTGSFCWNQKAVPTYNYDQQINSQSVKQAKLILSSIKVD